MAAVVPDFRPIVRVNSAMGYANEVTIPRTAIGLAVQTVPAAAKHRELA